MSTKLVTATFDDDDQECGPVFVPKEATATAVITATMTVTPHISASGEPGTYIEMTDDAKTATGAWSVIGPCYVKLVSSNNSSGGADCEILAI